MSYLDTIKQLKEDRDSLYLLLCAYLYYSESTGLNASPLSDYEYDMRLKGLPERINWNEQMVGFDPEVVVKELERQKRSYG